MVHDSPQLVLSFIRVDRYLDATRNGYRFSASWEYRVGDNSEKHDIILAISFLIRKLKPLKNNIKHGKWQEWYIVRGFEDEKQSNKVVGRSNFFKVYIKILLIKNEYLDFFNLTINHMARRKPILSWIIWGYSSLYSKCLHWNYAIKFFQ